MAEEDRKMNFYEDIYQAGLYLTQREREQLYTAVLDYYFQGAEPDLRGAPAAVFTAVRKRVELSKAREGSGREGGRRQKRRAPEGSAEAEADAKQTASRAESKTEANAKQNASKTEANPDGAGEVACGLLGGDREGDREEEHTKGVCSSARAEANGGQAARQGHPPHPSPPSPAEVAAYLAASCRPAIDAERFCNVYAARGWLDGSGRPYADWRPLALNWAAEDARRAAARPPARGEARADELADLDL